ncbi:hypothetical protein RUM44_001444 [Polyplax serrata]|uniref:Uncharacterized protein n=1 Tax=Polyplax serrata TaxID=468196 RepID=A0ABR1AKR5_POLSC
MRVVVTQVFVLFNVAVSASLIPSNTSDFVGDLTRLTDQILSRYFDRFRCLTYITNDLEGVLPVKRDLPVFLINFANSTSAVQDGLLRESHELSCGGFIIQINSGQISSLMDRFVAIKRKAVCCRYNNQRYLFLPVRETTTDFSFMTHSNVTYFPNLVFVSVNETESSRDGFVLFGHTVFNHYKHQVLNVSHEVLDYWTPERGFEYRNDLFPDRVANVMGRKFMFAALQYPPFNLALNENGKTIFDGFETRIAALFVETVNGTWNAKNYDDLWGDLFVNGTGTGVVGAIVGEKADFGFSGFYQWYCEDVDCIKPFYQSGITCLVPRPKLLSEWLTIVLPFTESTWTALIFAYFFNTGFFMLLLLVMKHLRGSNIFHHLWLSLSDSFFVTFRIQLQQIPKIRRYYKPLAVYVRIMVFFSYFVVAFWQGGIASSLTVPRYEKPIDEAGDLVKQWPRIKWGADSTAWINSIRASSDPNLIEIVRKFIILDGKTLREKTKTEDFGFFIEELPHGHYGFSEYIQEDSIRYLRLMRKKIYRAFGVIMLPKGSPFTEKLDRFVMRIYDTGLVHKIEVQATLERINNKLQNMIRTSNEKPSNRVKLAVRHIEGSLVIFGLGMSVAFITFVIELFTVMNKRFLSKLFVRMKILHKTKKPKLTP